MLTDALAYTSLISATDFDPIQVDLVTAISGILALALVVVGGVLIYKVLFKN
jgi:hypothetical protein